MGGGKPSAQNLANPILWGNAVLRSRSLPWPSLSHWLSGAHSRPGGKVLCPWLGLRRWALCSPLILSSLQMHKFLTKV